MAATLTGGWLCVPYDGPDAVVVELGTNTRGQDPDWQPAFLDWHDGQRVAKVRPAVGGDPRVSVWLRVGGVVTNMGRYPLA